MNSIYSIKTNIIEAEHKDKVNQWLADARKNGKEGQYFIYQVETSKVIFSYVYRKGYTNYEVSFIYDPSEPKLKGNIHVFGAKKSPQDTLIQIKSIHDPSMLFILDDEKLKSKLTKQK